MDGPRSRPPVLRMIEREWIVWKRIWRGSVFSAFVAPVLYLAAMGVGLGDLIDKSSGNVSGVSYLAFVAPGLLAASLAMNSAGESLWPVLGGVKWVGSYHAAVSTPVDSSDVYLGQLLWTAYTATLLSATIFLIAASAGRVPSCGVCSRSRRGARRSPSRRRWWRGPSRRRATAPLRW
jgi:lipooligosaccharide transport system permease protein